LNNYNEEIVGSENSNANKFKRSYFNILMILEIVLLLIFPIPFYDLYIVTVSRKEINVVYFLSEIFTSIMTLRLYFIARTVVNFSIYTDAFSKQLCKAYGFMPGVHFNMKCYMINHTSQIVVTLFLSTVFFFAFNIRVFELPYFRLESDEAIKNTLDSYFNSIYFTVITMTTVGFGDIPVCTFPGRLIVTILAVWGSFMMSLMVVTVQ